MTDAVEYQYIDSDAALAEACSRWQRASFLAIDTEFIRRDTFYPIAGLLQVGADGHCALIDPLAIADWAPLVALFENEAVTKVIHSCSEDLEVFQRLLNCLPKPLMDTQIGAGMAGIGVGLSYQNLVLNCLGIHVDKGETRSDWLKRPLSSSQCDYAALDVVYLQKVYPILCEKLAAQGRLVWWQEDCARMMQAAANPLPLSEYYTRVKGHWKLRSAQRRSLQQLCTWREEEARRRDIPRGRVLKDAVCFEIARRQPRDMANLSRIKDVPAPVLRRDGETILAIIIEAANSGEAALPAAQQPLNGDQTRLLKRLRNGAEKIAEETSVPVEVLARKKDFEDLIQTRDVPAALDGWRREIVAQPLLDLIGKPAAQSETTDADEERSEGDPESP